MLHPPQPTGTSKRRFRPSIRPLSAAAMALSVGLSFLVTLPSKVTADPPAAPENVTERPDLVSAQISARAQKSRVEVAAERTETSSTWANPDGTLTTEVFSGPIRTRNAEGALVPIDLTLVEQEGRLRPKASSSDVEISAAGEGGPFATVRGGRRLTRDLVALEARQARGLG